MQRSAARPASRPARAWTVRTASWLGLVLVAMAAVAIGSVAVPPLEVLGAVRRGLLGRAEGPLDAIVWQVRLPRVLLAGLTGAALSLAGVAYQAVFRNPLADPYLLGAASGAGFGAALALVYGASVPALAALGAGPAAFLAAAATVAAVLTLARRGGRLPIVSLILAGVVLGSSLSAATSFVMLPTASGRPACCRGCWAASRSRAGATSRGSPRCWRRWFRPRWRPVAPST